MPFAIRHRGTFGGSVAHADPAGDLPTVAAALDAEMVLVGPGGQRTVAARDFFVDFFTTAIQPDALGRSSRILCHEYSGFRYRDLHP